MPIVAHYIAESKHLFFHSGDFPQWLRLFKKNGRKRPGAGGMCGRRLRGLPVWKCTTFQMPAAHTYHLPLAAFWFLGTESHKLLQKYKFLCRSVKEKTIQHTYTQATM